MNQVEVVTGGACFIGSNFTLAWIESGLGTVVNIDKLTYADNLENLVEIQHNPSHIFVRGDIGDQSLVSQHLAEHKPCSVVNFAAESHVD